MKLAENKRTVLVGIFVLVAILIFVAGIFILGGRQNRFERTIRLQAVFEDVDGLRKGNNVWFSGVRVGTVREINFFGASEVEVVVQIQENVQQYIRKDASVQLGSDGLIGNRILTITGGSPSAPVIQDGDRLAVEKGVSTEEMLASLQENNANLVSITRNLKDLSTGLAQGEGTAGALLRDTQMADNFRDVVANLQQVSMNTVQASNALNQFTAKLNTPGGLAGDLLTDTVVFNQLRASAEQLQQTIASAEQVANNLTEASTRMTATDNTVGMLLNDEQFGNQVRSTMRNLETSSEKLDENLEALQHNILFRGFFRKRAREEARNEQAARHSDTTQQNAAAQNKAAARQKVSRSY
jgi:phospholipid/cholesterol/gamma-HCH transport system substrate-binding protein